MFTKLIYILYIHIYQISNGFRMVLNCHIYEQGSKPKITTLNGNKRTINSWMTPGSLLNIINSNIAVYQHMSIQSLCIMVTLAKEKKELGEYLFWQPSRRNLETCQKTNQIATWIEFKASIYKC